MASGDVKLAYAASASLTITLASLASDSNLLAGRESTAVANTSNLYQDILVSGKITTGTSPTVSKNIYVFAYAAVNDTPTYPGVFDGTDSGETTVAATKANCLALLAVITVTATSDVTYWFGPKSLAAAFGGVVPTHWGVFVVHDTAVNLNSTAGNHAIYYTPVYNTVAP